MLGYAVSLAIMDIVRQAHVLAPSRAHLFQLLQRVESKVFLLKMKTIHTRACVVTAATMDIVLKALAARKPHEPIYT
jgi:hypothetical protein